MSDRTNFGKLTKTLLRVPVPWVFVLTYLAGVGIEAAFRPGGFFPNCKSLTSVGYLIFIAGAGLAGVCHHSRAHRFFARARWHPDAVGLAVLRLIVGHLVQIGAPLIVAVVAVIVLVAMSVTMTMIVSVMMVAVIVAALVGLFMQPALHVGGLGVGIVEAGVQDLVGIDLAA